MARDGEAADPMQPAPASLRRYLRFAKLPTPALDIARRVLDDDDAFRQRVAGHTSEDEVGEAGWLWLTRPPGWEGRVESIRRATHAQEAHAREERADRDAHRRLAGAEAAARRAEATAAARAREVDELRAALEAERNQLGTLGSELNAAREQLAHMTDERTAAVRKLKDTEAELANRAGDLRHARHQIRMLQAELAQALEGRPATTSEAASATPPIMGRAQASPDGPAVEAATGLDRDGLAAAVAAAAAAAEHLSAALAGAARLLEQPQRHAEGVAASGGTAASTSRGEARVGRRVPVRLPPGMVDDEPAAADHLLRVADTVLLVDGYNVSQEGWPGTAIAQQRVRLIDALVELHARTGIEVVVVFDGAEGYDTRHGPLRAEVRIRFSPPGVEADDVVLDLVASLPASRPVVVASSDRRVRDGAYQLGANLLHSRQLLTALHR